MKIDGREISKQILSDLKSRVARLNEEKIIPFLAIIIVGNDPASTAYVRQKELKAKDIGIRTKILRLSDKASQANILKIIERLNNDNNINGIIVQQPLPESIDVKKITQAIDPKKDVDGFHLNSHFEMPINMSVLKIIEVAYLSIPNVQVRFPDWLKNKKIVIVGKGETGGKPIIQMFKAMKIPFEIIDSKTKNPENIMKKADIIVSAVGKKNVIKAKAIKKGVILIGIGISRKKNAELTGDYDQDKIKNIASFYAPVPGGIGPINVAMLLKNLTKSVEDLY